MLIFSMLSLLASAKLRLFLGGELKQVNYSLGNFGHIPYGRTITGALETPHEIIDQLYDLCNLTNVYPLNYSEDFWLIARNGNCTATTKAYVAQQLKAKMLIIISDRENVSQKVEMHNDGMGFRVHIPTVMIGRKDGEQLIKEFSTLMDARPFGIMSFNDSKRVEKPQVILFNTLSDLDEFKFLRQFRPYFEQLKDKVDFQITYDVVVSKADKRLNFTKENADCMGGGRYCIDSITAESTGRQVIEEQLRQHCIWLDNPLQWFDYMEYFDKNCDKVQNYEECFKENTIVNHDKVNDCVVRSYTQTSEVAKPLRENYIMDQWVGNKTYSGMMYYPGVLVNNNPYKGNLDAQDVTEDICSNMLDETICAQILVADDSSSANNNVNWAMISFAIVSCILFGLFLFLCYRRRLKQQMQQELGQQVNEMVSQYIKFYETKNEGA